MLEFAQDLAFSDDESREMPLLPKTNASPVSQQMPYQTHFLNKLKENLAGTEKIEEQRQHLFSENFADHGDHEFNLGEFFEEGGGSPINYDCVEFKLDQKSSEEILSQKDE